MEWISTAERYPEDKQRVLMRLYDAQNNCYVEIPAIFNDYENHRGWEIKEEYFTMNIKYAVPQIKLWKPLKEDG